MRLTRVLFGATAVVLALSLAATLAWVLVTVTVRPLDGVEGDVFFEADRIRAGLPLYTDPAMGVFDYGPPTTRYLVLYPPLWSGALSLFPPAVAVVAGRLAAAAAWFGIVGFVAWRAPRSRRPIVAAGGAFVAGLWVLALYGGSARPDAVAVLASGLALERAARRAHAGRRAPVDLVVGVLFAVAAWTKPNVVGAAPGAFLGCFFATRGALESRLRAVSPGVIGLVATSTLAGAVLHLASDGVWLEHLLRSTGQPPSGKLWLHQLGQRGPFFLLPLGAAAVLGARARRDPAAMVATSALLTSTAWCLLSLAKTGSASNYYMEPCVAALVVLGYADLGALGRRARPALAAVCLLQASWNGVASVRGVVRELPLAFERARVLAELRTTCDAEPSDVVLADEPGLELALNGRVVMTPFQSTHLGRRGLFPVEAWARDVASPRARCLVMQDDLLERPLHDVRIEHDRFGPELRSALGARFELVATRAGYWIYRATDRVP